MVMCQAFGLREACNGNWRYDDVKIHTINCFFLLNLCNFSIIVIIMQVWKSWWQVRDILDSVFNGSLILSC